MPPQPSRRAWPWRLALWLAAAAASAAALAVAATTAGLFRVGPLAAAVTYYVSPAGNDGAQGTSPGTAWRTLARASAAVLRPGDRLLLQGGARFTGRLALGPGDAGDPARPVRIGSYGTGRATIEGAGSGIVVTDTAGLDISGLRITARRAAPPGAGIVLFSDLSRRHRLAHVVISGVDVSGFENGILIGASGRTGFAGVRISDSVVHGNLASGISSYGPPFDPRAPAYPHARIVITGVRAYGNLGDPRATGNTGNGIVLGGVAGGRIAWSTAYGNGGRGRSVTEGPVGIWTYDSTGIVIEHDLSYGNHSPNAHDGGGFGLDQNTSRCVLQYDLSYGNWGPGFLIYTGRRNGADTGDVARFDISSGDARVPHGSGGILVAGWVRDVAVYQDTVVTGAWSGGVHAPLRLGRSVRGVTVRNSIFVAASRPGPLAYSPWPLRRGQALLQGNDYYEAAPAPPGAPAWSVGWGGVSYRSLPAWRAATGQETLAGRPARPPTRGWPARSWG